MSVRLPWKGVMPTVAETAFVAPNTSLIGDVEVAELASIWFGSTLRGDVMPIRIGARTSIQDNSVVHATEGWAPTIVGEDCVVGHGVILHGCTLGNRVLVGMGTVILDEVEIGDDVLIGAGSLITPRTKLPSGTLVLGRPAKPKRDLTDAERASIVEGAAHYVKKCEAYRKMTSGG